MKSLLVIFCLAFFGTSMGNQEKGDKSVSEVRYELYSWKDSRGGWNFSLLIPTNRVKTPDEIFSQNGAIRGVDELKQRISHVAPRSQIVWMKNPFGGTPMKGTEALTWPPEEIMRDVKRYAATKLVEIVWVK